MGVALLAAWSVLLQGCYESLPLQQGAAPAARRVELVLNDEGRVGLRSKLGPAVDRIEGEIVSQDTGSYTISVFHLRQMNGNSATWTGEQVAVAKEYTIGYQLRQLNKARTTFLAAGVTVALFFIFFGKSLNIGGGGPGSPPPTETFPPHLRVHR